MFSKESLPGKETPSLLRIGVDIDGIVAADHFLIAEILNKRFNFSLELENMDFYDITRVPKIAKTPGAPEYVNRLFAGRYLYARAEPVPGAVETLNRWHQQGFELWFPTARPEKARRVTERWFVKHGLVWANDRLLFYD